MPVVCWSQTKGPELNQGDLLPGIPVPLFRLPIRDEMQIEGDVETVTEIVVRDAIIVSHTCDLLQDKIRLVALCPVLTITDYEEQQPRFAKEWKNVQKGRHEGLHLLGPSNESGDHKKALVVDFREIISLPRGYVERHASDCDNRYRLASPFLEHFSQCFGRFYMRVALPEFISLP